MLFLFHTVYPFQEGCFKNAYLSCTKVSVFDVLSVFPRPVVFVFFVLPQDFK